MTTHGAAPEREASLVHPSAALGAHLENLVAGRRVAVLGDSALPLADELVARGARLVHVYDPDAIRAAASIAKAGTSRAGAGSRVAVAPLDSDLGVRDGAFDVVVVPELTAFADAALAVRRARRLVSAAGVVAIASPNGEVGSQLVPHGARASAPLGYYELYDLVALHFSRVRMIGQSPFVGYTVADFAPEGEPEVSVDTSLLASPEPPEIFVAIASERDTELPSYAVIELPFEAIAPRRAPSFDRRPASVERREAEEYAKRAADLEREAEALRREIGSVRGERDERARQAVASAARLAEVESAREDERRARDRAERSDAERARALEAAERARDAERERASEAATRLAEAERRAGDAHVRAERLEHDLRELEEELRRQRDRGVKLSKQLDDEKRARHKAEVELGMVRGSPEIAGSKDRLEAAHADLEKARARLRELESAAGELEGEREKRAELERRERKLARELDAAEASRARLEAALDERQGEIDRLKELRAADAAELDRLADLLRSADIEVHEARAELDELRAAVAGREGDEAGKEEEAAGELAALEALLRERGARMRELERDLRESERVGRELIEELERARLAQANAADGAAAALGATPTEEEPRGAVAAATAGDDEAGLLRTQLEALAVAAAKREADLQASTWRIAQLERELAREQRVRAEPGERERALEAALAAAQHELAVLRLASAEGDPRAAAVAEQAVLLQQVEDRSPPRGA